MNVLLVRPKPDIRTISLQKFMICEPLELEYLAAHLERAGHVALIADMIIEKKPLRFFVENFKPGIVGFTAYLPHINVVKAYAAEVKAVSPGAVTIVGGVHADVRPDDFLDANIDRVVSGNGVDAMLAIAAGNIAPAGSAASSASENAAIFDALFPDRAKTSRYRKKYNYVFHNRCATIKTSFGCPNNCDFCFCARIADGKYGCRDLNRVMEELRGIREKNVFIVDDCFLVSAARAENFCRLLEQYGVRKRFILFGRADFIAKNPDTMKMLKSAGLHAVFIGVESFRQDELDGYNKMTAADNNDRAIRVLEDLGVLCYCGLMVGRDWERRDFDMLIKRLRTFRLPMINLQPTTPIPGTPYFEREKNGMQIGIERCEIWDMAHLLMKPLKITEKEFYANILRVYRKINLRPRIHAAVLFGFGPRAYFRACRGAIAIYLQYLELCKKGCVFT